MDALNDWFSSLSGLEVFGVMTTLAATLATLVSLMVNAIWKKADHPRPEWSYSDVTSEWVVHEKHELVSPSVKATVHNVGDGPATNFWVFGSGCKIVGPRNKALLGPGDEIRVIAECYPSGWEVASILLVWHQKRIFRSGFAQKTKWLPLDKLVWAPFPLDSQGNAITRELQRELQSQQNPEYKFLGQWLPPSTRWRDRRKQERVARKRVPR